MGLARRIARDLQVRDTEFAAGQGGLLRSLFRGWGEDTYADKAVTTQSALGLAAVWSAVRIRSEDVGSIPLVVYRRNGRDGTRSRAADSYQYELLHESPNPEMSAMDAVGMLETSLCTHGNAYYGKVFANTPLGPQLVEWWPIDPCRITKVWRENGRKLFEIDGRKTYDSSSVGHIKGLTLDGLLGLSPIHMQRNAIAMGIALDEYAGKLFANRAVPEGVVQMKGTLTPAAAKDFRARWETQHKGSGRAKRVAVLDNEAEFKAISLPLADAQFVQVHQLTIQQVARIFRLPPSKLGVSAGDSMTYANIESAAQDYINNGLRTDLVRIEQAFKSDPDFFPKPARRGGNTLYPEFLVDALLRGDSNARSTYYQAALNGRQPWMKVSEVRERENLAADPDLDKPPAPAPPAPVVEPPDPNAPAPPPPPKAQAT